MFTKKHRSTPTAEISRQAAAWWIQLKDDEHLSIDDACRFVAWLMRSHRHVAEYMLIVRQDRVITHALRANRQAANVTHVNWWRGSAMKKTVVEPRRRRPIVGWSVAAAALATVCVGFFVAGKNVGLTNGTIATAASEPEVRRLKDGSKVSLDTHSTLRVEFNDHRRDVHLFQGKATFQVAREENRPFVVNTFLVGISAVDSTFAVKIDTSVEVEVFEGVVEISGRGARAGAPVRAVKKGETYRVPVESFRALVANGGNGRLNAALTDG